MGRRRPGAQSRIRVGDLLRGLALVPLLLGGCGGVLSGEDLPLDDPGAPSPFADPQPPDCPESATGVGAVWLGDAGEERLVERPLYCLDGSGRLGGTFVTSIEPDAWQPASHPEAAFVYDLADDHLQEVQAYYAIVGMAGYFQALVDGGRVPPVQVSLLAGDSFAISRFWLPDRLRLGLSGLRPEVLSIQILCHEYGHHLIMMHAPEIEQVLNEALADYLAADFTGTPQILSLERMDLPQALLDDPEAVAVARQYLDRSVDSDAAYPDDLVTQQRLCELLRQAKATFPPGTSGLVPEVKLQQCETMSADELAAPEPHRSGTILAGALWELRGQLGSQAVNELVFQVLRWRADRPEHLAFLTFGDGLLEADAELHAGAHGQAIRAALEARGL